MKIKIGFFVLLSLLLSGSILAQKNSSKITITGVVVDESKKPVSGAIILADKKNTNVVTDVNGYYRIKVKSDTKVLSAFSYNGLSGDEEIKGRTTIYFTLKGSQSIPTDQKTDKENKVEVGYGNMNKDEVTMPVNQVEMRDNKNASYSTIYDLLRGTVPGIQIFGKSIRLQGTGTTNGNSDPLLVVDGQIVSSIDYIHPREVKSIEVLKGASASIYGSRGANGVLMIKLISGPEKK
jgi:TonB-dependent SusC/RagA subfamily outer membrane receptor